MQPNARRNAGMNLYVGSEHSKFGVKVPNVLYK